MAISWAAHAAADRPSLGVWVPPLLILVALGLFIVLHRRARARSARQAGRPKFFLVGTVLMMWALSPPLDARADNDFSIHMAQHLIAGMLAPTALVLAAPVTVALRGLSTVWARRLTRFIHAGPVRVLTRPVTALTLNSGGLVALYCTPIYTARTTNEGVHALVHFHLIASGCLFAWVIAGPDPAPNRPTVRARLFTMAAAIAIHSTVSQLIVAGLFTQVHAPRQVLRAAGNLMFFGGDMAELLLALALLTTWRPSRSRPLLERPAGRVR